MIDVPTALRRARATLGLDIEVLAEAAGLEPGTLGAYEAGTQQVPGDVLWRLSDALGIPIEDIDTEVLLGRHLEVMAVRFRAAQRAVPDRVRLAVARAASAARDYVDLEDIAGRPGRYRELVERWPRAPQLPRRETWKAGRELATTVRERLGLDGPVISMLNLVEKQVGALVIWQKLPVDIAGYAFCDEIHGPAVVLNVNGRNQNELTRRFTLAHEACHVLFDRYDLAALSRFDAYDDFYEYGDDARDPHEVRSNAFAIHLLAPDLLLRRTWTAHPGNIREVMLSFGISFEATRAHLANYGLLPLTERVTGVSTAPSDEWRAAESSELWYPAFDDIPIERRHAVAKLAFELWVTEKITTSRLREVLRAYLSHDQLTELAELYLGTLVG
jgi:Zn-dependent peptidase ImmA (M78 family)/transcriptional regulator with XRE-family HTH domain